MNNITLKNSLRKAIFTTCNKTDLSVLDKILLSSFNNAYTFPSQSTLASMVGLKSRRQVIRIIQRLVDLQLIRLTSGQETKQTNIYRPNPLLLEMSYEFKDILSSCKQHEYNKSISHQQENVTLYIKDIIKNYNYDLNINGSIKSRIFSYFKVHYVKKGSSLLDIPDLDDQFKQGDEQLSTNFFFRCQLDPVPHSFVTLLRKVNPFQLNKIIGRVENLPERYEMINNSANKKTIQIVKSEISQWLSSFQKENVTLEKKVEKKKFEPQQTKTKMEYNYIHPTTLGVYDYISSIKDDGMKNWLHDILSTKGVMV